MTCLEFSLKYSRKNQPTELGERWRNETGQVSLTTEAGGAKWTVITLLICLKFPVNQIFKLTFKRQNSQGRRPEKREQARDEHGKTGAGP